MSSDEEQCLMTPVCADQLAFYPPPLHWLKNNQCYRRSLNHHPPALPWCYPPSASENSGYRENEIHLVYCLYATSCAIMLNASPAKLPSCVFESDSVGALFCKE